MFCVLRALAQSHRNRLFTSVFNFPRSYSEVATARQAAKGPNAPDINLKRNRVFGRSRGAVSIPKENNQVYSPQSNPQPIGAVKVPSPGTPVPLNTALVAAGLCVATDAIPVNKVSLVSLPSNTGNVYIGVAGMNKATLSGVLYVFSSANAAWQITNNQADNTYRLERMYVDADNANEGIYGAVDQI